ncbi:MAG: rhodanese-like domain-containing protein [Methylococcaceae bacterium]
MSLREITPKELRHLLEESNPPPLLLDVREAHEFEYCHIMGSVHIPMDQLPSRITELDADQAIVVICHHGIRSLRVANYLASCDFSQLMNLSGGVEAWARSVDPDMPRY